MSSAPPSPAAVALNFTLGDAPTFAALQVSCGNTLIDLGAHPHHSCLVALAKRRIADATVGVRRAEQGWCTRTALCILLELVPSDVNVFIFRARHQWLTAVPNLGELIERRWDAFRLAPLPFELHRNGVTEGRYASTISGT